MNGHPSQYSFAYYYAYIKFKKHCLFYSRTLETVTSSYTVTYISMLNEKKMY